MHRVLIIGSGDMGRAHATAWAVRDDVAIDAVCGQGGPRAAELAAPYQAKVYHDWQEAIAHEALDAVSICTPTHTHAPIAIACAQRGLHVITEKPMALTLEEADAMIQAAQDHGTQLSVSHHYRTLGRFQLYRNLIKTGTLGPGPYFLRLVDLREVRPKLAMHRASMNGGPVHDMTGHFIDAARFLFETEVEEVSACGHIFAKGKDRVAEVEDLGMDTAEILLRFADGHAASLQIGWGLPEGTPDYGLEMLTGSLGLARCAANGLTEGEAATVTLHTKDGLNQITAPADPHVRPALRIAELIDAINTGQAPPVDGKTARETLRLILAAKESALLGRAIPLSAST